MIQPMPAVQLGGAITAAYNATGSTVALPTKTGGALPRWLLISTTTPVGVKAALAGDATAWASCYQIPQDGQLMLYVAGSTHIRIIAPAAGTPNVSVAAVDNM